MRTTQQMFFEKLESIVGYAYGSRGDRHPFELIRDPQFANTGHFRIIRTGQFEPVLALRYDFQDGYASFDVLDNTPLIGDRQGKSFPYVRFDELGTRVLQAIEKHLQEVA